MAERFGVHDAHLAARLNQTTAADDPPPIRPLGEYLDSELISPPELVTPRFLVRGGVTATIADAGKGKTSLGLNRVLAWAAGRPQHDELHQAFVPSHPLRTLLIENEGAGGLFQEKIATMLASARERFDEDAIALMRENVLIWGEGGYAGVHLDEPTKLAQVRRGIEEWRPDVVLMEPFARLWRGDENSNTEMNALLTALEDLAAKYDVAILVAHHQRKGKGEAGDEAMDRARGASALSGAVTYMEFFRPSKGGAERELACAKNRYGPAPGPFRLRWREDNSGWYDFVPADVTLSELIALLLPDEPSLLKDLADQLEEPENRVRRMLNHELQSPTPRVRRVQGLGHGYAYMLNEGETSPEGGPTF